MKILLATDDQTTGAALAQELRAALPGNIVQLAIGSARALEIARSSGIPDVLVTEAFFDSDDGFVLRHHLRELNPLIGTVFTTRYDLSEHRAYLEGAPHLLHPVTGPQLAKAIQEALAAPVSVPASSGPPAESAAPAGALPSSFGPYTLLRSLGRGRWGEVFEAVQTSLNRRVALKVFSAERTSDRASVEAFRAAAQAKASLHHPSVLPVYEAGVVENTPFFACEFVDGTRISELATAGTEIDASSALHLIRTTAEALTQLAQRGVPREQLDAGGVFLGRDGRARLENLATTLDAPAPDPAVEIRLLGAVLANLVPPSGLVGQPALGRLLMEMHDEKYSVWGAVASAAKAAEPKVAPKDAYALGASERAAIAVVEAAKQRQKRSLVYSTLGLFALLWVLGGLVYWRFFSAPPMKEFSRSIEIPAGEFIYQNGQKLTLPAFSIDEHEVTIGQYAQFLAALEKDPALAARLDHPDQPKGKPHVPERWENLSKSAANAKTFLGAPVDLNCPVILIDWFDASAYAKWKGRRLPTEQEWEKAARGTDGRRFPWGEDEKATERVNTAQDFSEDPRLEGKIDGFNRWAPVDATPGDRSPYGVMGMAGNVSEFTATVDNDRPVVRGGNFGSRKDKKPDVELIRRVTSLLRLDKNDRVGFRTAADAVAK